jgi:hypothetical protein
MIAELEKANNKYIYKIIKGKKVVLEPLWCSFATSTYFNLEHHRSVCNAVS